MNPKLKKIAIGSGLTGASAAIAYAAPLLASAYSGTAWITIALAVVPTLVAFLTDSRKKVEESE